MNFAELYQKKLVCLNPADVWVHGAYNSKRARHLNFQLKKCRGSPECKTEEEILDFFRDKYLIILYNQIRFDGRQ